MFDVGLGLEVFSIVGSIAGVMAAESVGFGKRVTDGEGFVDGEGEG